MRGSNDSPAWLIVMQREIVARVMNKAYLFGLLVTLLLIAGIAGFFAWQSQQTDSYDVAVTAGDEAAATAVDQAAAELRDGDELTVIEVADADAARAAVEDETADVWLSSGEDGWTLSGWREPSGSLTQLLAPVVERVTVTERAEALGTTFDELSAGGELVTERLDGGAVDPGVVEFASFALAFLFFLSAIGSGQMIAASVVEEKQSRLVEIIASAVPLRQVLGGKVLGNSVIALGQNLLFASVGLVGLALTDFKAAVPAMTASLGWFVIFFAVGFVAVAALYAMAGALASRLEDLQGTTAPMSVVLMAVYLTTFGADGTLERVLSFVPVTSIVSMPVRVLAGDASWWEPVVSLVLLAVFAVGVVLVSERAYRRALLQTGGRVGWRQALRAG
ncbi:ABC transporter permease [Myceligenerans xiligouense]|uniref:ABC-2 type transport system permease protein n=1 Tax=Myceligenerans xiligouense TaxID=253184 RepID=A0A3N4ZQU4_9MICO|nr:ABC transporter permease [Myceligenerans xiligouense]RPF23315.1 ABC-2 type transport system permease protein [Myceligenerans xiligouense]